MLDRETILRALQRLADLLKARAAEGEVPRTCLRRIGAGPAEPGDVSDIRFLISHLGLRSAEEAREIVARYYPEERIPPRAMYLLDDIFAGTDRK